MLTLKPTSGGVKMIYTHGDTFYFTASGEEFEAGTVLRFQISLNGNESNLIINKTFALTENGFEVSLTPNELTSLLNKTSYDYRLTFISPQNTIITAVSGIIDVVWGC